MVSRISERYAFICLLPKYLFASSDRQPRSYRGYHQLIRKYDNTSNSASNFRGLACACAVPMEKALSATQIDCSVAPVSIELTRRYYDVLTMSNYMAFVRN